MNYDEARQLSKDSDAPGKWNWTSMNDRVIRTAQPCAYPDYEWPERFDPLNPPSPTGRERCDHDTREDAERHYYDDRVSRIRIEALDLDAIRERRRCAFDDGEWETHRAHWPGGYEVDSLCERHADLSEVRSLHPFTPGMQVINW